MKPSLRAGRPTGMTHRGMATSILVAVLTLAAGCASQSKPSVSGSITSSGLRQSPSAIGSSAPATAEHNKKAAEDEAKRLLTLAPKPPGARSVAEAPTGLSGPAMGAPMTSSLIDQTEFWSVPMSLDDSIAWLRAHQPAGMDYLGESSGSGPGESYKGLAWAPNHDAQTDPGVGGPNLQVNVAAVDTQNSAWRVDAIDTWLDPVPRRDVADGPRMRVTVTGGCPSTDKGEAGVTNEGADLDAALLPAGGPTAGLICYYNGLNGMAFTLTRSVPLSAADAARVAVAANASQLSHLDDEHVNCPSDDGSQAVLAFSYSGRTDVDLDYALTGCSWVANGHIVATPSDALSALVDPRATAASASP